MIANNSAASLQRPDSPQAVRIASPLITKLVGSSTRPMRDPYGPPRPPQETRQVQPHRS